jgi:prepilin-type processing-associated H-X9-DG protein
LVELLVVIGIIAVLVGLLLPALTSARREANRAYCLANIRGFQVAQVAYAADNRGYLVSAGLGHGGTHSNEETAWFTVLQKYYGNKLLARCPSDVSPYWDVQNPADNRFRLTSYGINPYLDPHLSNPFWIKKVYKISQIRRTAATIQFLEMPDTGQFATSDHPHPNEWFDGTNDPALLAADQMATDRHGKRKRSPQSVANYGFLDGHAESLPFSKVYTNNKRNNFDPVLAQ